MNVNKLIKRLKDDLGLSRFVKLSYTDKDIYENIIVHSLEEWSHYFKQAVTFQDVFLDQSLQLEYDVYLLPKNIVDSIRKSGLVIEDVRQVLVSSDQAVAGVGTFVGAFLPDLNLSDSYTAIYANYRQGNAEAVNNMHYFQNSMGKPGSGFIDFVKITESKDTQGFVKIERTTILSVN